MIDSVLVTSAYFNILGYPHYGAKRSERIRVSLPNIAKNSKLPIICYTSKKYGCYDELSTLFDTHKIDNVTLKIQELEDHPWHDRILNIRMNTEPYTRMYELKPILVYWMKFVFLERELNSAKNVYWIDSGLSHNGMFPKKYAIGNTDRFGMSDCPATYDFSCFSNNLIEKISEYAGDKIFLAVRPSIDADFSGIMKNPTLYEKIKYSTESQYYPVAGFFGGSNKELLQTFIDEFFKVADMLLQDKFLTVEEGIMAYLSMTQPDLFNKYHFENFYTEEHPPELHIKPDGKVYHHFYRMFCDDAPLVDFIGK